MVALPDAHGVLARSPTTASRSRIARTGTGISTSRSPSRVSRPSSTSWCRRRGWPARKPHQTIYRHTLAALEIEPERTVRRRHVGMRRRRAWRMGMTPLYVRGDGHEPDHTAPADAVAGRLVECSKSSSSLPGADRPFSVCRASGRIAAHRGKPVSGSCGVPPCAVGVAHIQAPHVALRAEQAVGGSAHHVNGARRRGARRDRSGSITRQRWSRL